VQLFKGSVQGGGQRRIGTCTYRDTYLCNSLYVSAAEAV